MVLNKRNGLSTMPQYFISYSIQVWRSSLLSGRRDRQTDRRQTVAHYSLRTLYVDTRQKLLMILPPTTDEQWTSFTTLYHHCGI